MHIWLSSLRGFSYTLQVFEHLVRQRVSKKSNLRLRSRTDIKLSGPLPSTTPWIRSHYLRWSTIQKIGWTRELRLNASGWRAEIKTGLSWTSTDQWCCRKCITPCSGEKVCWPQFTALFPCYKAISLHSLAIDAATPAILHYCTVASATRQSWPHTRWSSTETWN